MFGGTRPQDGLNHCIIAPKNGTHFTCFTSTITFASTIDRFWYRGRIYWRKALTDGPGLPGLRYYTDIPGSSNCFHPLYHLPPCPTASTTTLQQPGSSSAPRPRLPPLPPCGHTGAFLRDYSARAQSIGRPGMQLLRCQYFYFCISKVSKLSSKAPCGM